MTSLFLFLILGFPLQADFTSFSFCRDGLGGADEEQCIQLDASGQGRFMIMAPDADTVDMPLRLSASGRGRFIELLSETDYLEDADEYDSGREVPSLGRKVLVLEGAAGRREAAFYLSLRREVTELASFFDRLITQELLVMDLETALLFDPLGIPGRLDQIQQDFDRDRLADARRLIPILERIASDSRVVNYARTAANRLKEQIENGD